MVNYKSPGKSRVYNKKPQKIDNKLSRHKRLIAMYKRSMGIINDLCSPIDVTNRFINLTLQTIEEGSQSREFLLESKRSIRKTSDLLKRLNCYAKEIEREIVEISTSSE